METAGTGHPERHRLLLCGNGNHHFLLHLEDRAGRICEEELKRQNVLASPSGSKTAAAY